MSPPQPEPAQVAGQLAEDVAPPPRRRSAARRRGPLNVPRPDAAKEAAARAQVTVDFAGAEALVSKWDTPRLEALVTSIVARHFPRGGSFALSLHLVGDAAIQVLNAEHRHIDAATDVLSFPLYEPDMAGFILPPQETINLGDVVVSYPRAVTQAADYGHSVEREVAYLVAHGVLHVLGYDHEVEREREHMRQLEEEALGPLGFTR